MTPPRKSIKKVAVCLRIKVRFGPHNCLLGLVRDRPQPLHCGRRPIRSMGRRVSSSWVSGWSSHGSIVRSPRKAASCSRHYLPSHCCTGSVGAVVTPTANEWSRPVCSRGTFRRSHSSNDRTGVRCGHRCHCRSTISRIWRFNDRWHPKRTGTGRSRERSDAAVWSWHSHGLDRRSSHWSITVAAAHLEMTQPRKHSIRGEAKLD